MNQAWWNLPEIIVPAQRLPSDSTQTENDMQKLHDSNNLPEPELWISDTSITDTWILNEKWDCALSSSMIRYVRIAAASVKIMFHSQIAEKLLVSQQHWLHGLLIY